MALCEKIVLAGFSGAGKSSLLREIKATAPAGWVHFDDLDQVILKTRGQKHRDLASLIEEVGWEQFRLWERQELEGWLKTEGKGVLSLGGGALTAMIWSLYGNSRKIKFCFLKASFEVCWERLNQGSELRPLVLKGKIEVEKIYKEREKLFRQIEWRLENENASLKDLANTFWLTSPGESK